VLVPHVPGANVNPFTSCAAPGCTNPPVLKNTLYENGEPAVINAGRPTPIVNVYRVDGSTGNCCDRIAPLLYPTFDPPSGPTGICAAVGFNVPPACVSTRHPGAGSLVITTFGSGGGGFEVVDRCPSASTNPSNPAFAITAPRAAPGAQNDTATA
jgi:hypothetical protein